MSRIVVYDQDLPLLTKAAAQDLIACATIAGMAKDYPADRLRAREQAIDQLESHVNQTTCKLASVIARGLSEDMRTSDLEKVAMSSAAAKLTLAMTLAGGGMGALVNLLGKQLRKEERKRQQGLPDVDLRRIRRGRSLLESIALGAALGGLGGFGLTLTGKGISSLAKAMESPLPKAPRAPNASHTTSVGASIYNKLLTAVGMDPATEYGLTPSGNYSVTSELSKAKAPMTGAGLGAVYGGRLASDIERARAVQEGIQEITRDSANSTNASLQRAARQADRLSKKLHRKVGPPRYGPRTRRLPPTAGVLRRFAAAVADLPGDTLRAARRVATAPKRWTYLGEQAEMGRAVRQVARETRWRPAVRSALFRGKYKFAKPKIKGGLTGAAIGWLLGDLGEHIARKYYQ